MCPVVKSEPMDESVDDHDGSLARDLIVQKEKHNEEIARLRNTYDAQIEKLRQELTFYRSFLNVNEGGEPTGKKTALTPLDASSKNAQLLTDNVKLKRQIDLLMTNYKLVTREIQEAREYLLARLADAD